MTRKQKAFVEAVRSGLGLEEAAAAAGYGVEYAARLLEEPAIRAAIDAPDQPEPEAPETPAEMLRGIAMDMQQDERVRITAARALYMQERDVKPKLERPILIDDVKCCNCPIVAEVSRIMAELGVPHAEHAVRSWNSEELKKQFL